MNFNNLDHSSLLVIEPTIHPVFDKTTEIWMIPKAAPTMVAKLQVDVRSRTKDDVPFPVLISMTACFSFGGTSVNAPNITWGPSYKDNVLSERLIDDDGFKGLTRWERMLYSCFPGVGYAWAIDWFRLTINNLPADFPAHYR